MTESAGAIAYRKGYKYQLHAPWWVQTGIVGHTASVPGFLCLEENGRLRFEAGYAWDGPSGPAVDSASSMRGALTHDGLYQLMREGQLPSSYRPAADALLRTICIEDGMLEVRADIWYEAVRLFAAGAARRADPEICTAP